MTCPYVCSRIVSFPSKSRTFSIAPKVSPILILQDTLLEIFVLLSPDFSKLAYTSYENSLRGPRDYFYSFLRSPEIVIDYSISHL